MPRNSLHVVRSQLVADRPADSRVRRSRAGAAGATAGVTRRPSIAAVLWVLRRVRHPTSTIGIGGLVQRVEWTGVHNCSHERRGVHFVTSSQQTLGTDGVQMAAVSCGWLLQQACDKSGLIPHSHFMCQLQCIFRGSKFQLREYRCQLFCNDDCAAVPSRQNVQMDAKPPSA